MKKTGIIINNSHSTHLFWKMMIKMIEDGVCFFIISIASALIGIIYYGFSIIQLRCILVWLRV